MATYAGYILGFPADTPESIERDIRLIQRELPVDILEFFILTPLPGSADHRDLYVRGVPMDKDLNRYDLEHVTTAHPRMTADQWARIYDRAWHLYYSPEHIKTMIRRAHATRGGTSRLITAILLYYGSYRFQHVHPLQSGWLRRKGAHHAAEFVAARESALVLRPPHVGHRGHARRHRLVHAAYDAHAPAGSPRTPVPALYRRVADAHPSRRSAAAADLRADGVPVRHM